MVVWGGIISCVFGGDVISQPQPDLPDTPLVTICLQCRDDRFYSPARWVSIRNHQLANLGRAQAHLALKNILHMREKLVILDPHVAIDQRFEYQKITERKNRYEHQRTSSRPLISLLETDRGFLQRWRTFFLFSFLLILLIFYFYF